MLLFGGGRAGRGVYAGRTLAKFVILFILFFFQDGSVG